MNSYVPFLKLKQGEIKALEMLKAHEKLSVTPLIELPRDDLYTAALLKKRIDLSARRLKKACSDNQFTFFLDNYEVSDDITIEGAQNYEYLLESLSGYRIIPVCGVDRTETHNALSVGYAKNNEGVIALRITPEFIRSIAAYLADFDALFLEIGEHLKPILLVDCRLVNVAEVSKLSLDITKLIKLFSTRFGVNEIVVGGSSLPAFAGMYIKPDSEVYLDRSEIKLFREVVKSAEGVSLTFGDYSTVSPDFSELSLDPRMMPNVMTARIVYSADDFHYVVRGVSLKVGGFEQYFDIAKKIAGKSFYRGPQFSWGDDYLSEKSNRIGNNCTPSTVIAPTANAHLSFMIRQLSNTGEDF